jgi:hypothetical protein
MRAGSNIMINMMAVARVVIRFLFRPFRLSITSNGYGILDRLIVCTTCILIPGSIVLLLLFSMFLSSCFSFLSLFSHSYLSCDISCSITLIFVARFCFALQLSECFLLLPVCRVSCSSYKPRRRLNLLVSNSSRRRNILVAKSMSSPRFCRCLSFVVFQNLVVSSILAISYDLVVALNVSVA